MVQACAVHAGVGHETARRCRSPLAEPRRRGCGGRRRPLPPERAARCAAARDRAAHAAGRFARGRQRSDRCDGGELSDARRIRSRGSTSSCRTAEARVRDMVGREIEGTRIARGGERENRRQPSQRSGLARRVPKTVPRSTTRLRRPRRTRRSPSSRRRDSIERSRTIPCSSRATHFVRATRAPRACSRPCKPRMPARGATSTPRSATLHGGDTPEVQRARQALADAESRRNAAEGEAVAAVNAELSARAGRLIADLQRNTEAAQFGVASAAFFRAIDEHPCRWRSREWWLVAQPGPGAEALGTCVD